MATLRLAQPWATLQDFADIPNPGEVIDSGKPVLTLFARTASVDDCIARLRDIAGELDRRLLGP